MSEQDVAKAADRRTVVARMVERLFNRQVGGLTGKTGRAASITHTFLVFLIALTFAWIIFHMTFDLEGLAWLISINVGAAIGYFIGVVAVRLGYQTTASMIALGVANTHIFLSTQVLGWQSGMHLYLIAGGQLVLLLFTDTQHALRWIFVSLAAVTFVYAQLAFPSTSAPYAMPAEVIAVVFTVNALVTAGLMYFLAAMSHISAVTSSRLAAASAARAEYLANTDALTGLSNRRPIMEHLEKLGAREDAEYCVGLADLDHFKRLNDDYGHVCGDRVLATLGERLRNEVRPHDSIGRWGGEEFIFVLPHVSLEDAVVMMERMRSTVGEHVVPCSGHSHHVTVSIGVSSRLPGAMSHRVIKRADDALYEAKLGGRDRVCALRPETEDTDIDSQEIAINPGGGEGHRTHRRSV